MILLRTFEDLARLLDDRNIQVLSIRRPSEQTNGQWQVSTKMTDFSLDWKKGKPSPDINSAIESCLGVKVQAAPITELLV